MARQDEFDFEEFDFDEFGNDDPMGDGLSIKDDRSPTTKVASGFLNGVKQTATSGTFMKKLVVDSLPKGYSAAVGVADQIASESSGLYNEILAETKPATKELKRAVKSVAGLLDPIIPKKLSERIKEALEEDPDPAQQQVDANEAAIAAGLAGIFEQQEATAKRDEAADAVRDTVERRRFHSQTSQLDEIRKHLQRLANYQDGITIQWQRKMLELSYRTFFANRDMLSLNKAYAQESVTILRAIQKNTGLPDAVKLQTDEIASQMLKERLIGKAQEYVSNSTSGFIRELFQNIRGHALEKARDFRDTASAAAFGADSLTSAAELAQMSGVDGYQMAGEFAGSAATNSLAARLGKWFRKKTDASPKLAYGAEKAIDWAENLPGYVRNWAKSDTDWNNPWAGTIDFAKSVVPFQRGAGSVGYNNISNSTQPAVFDNQTHLTINEIIPGYLARLLQSSEGIRTGSSDVPLTVFDKGSNDFVSAKSLGQTIFKKALGQYDLDTISRRTDLVIGDLDPNNTLDKDAKNALRKELLERSEKSDLFDPKSYLDENSYGRNVTPEQARQFADLIRTAYSMDGEGNVAKDVDTARKHNKLSRSFKDLKSVFPNIQDLVSMYTNTGHRDVLRKIGLLVRKGDAEYVNDKFVFEKYKDYLSGESNYERSVLSAFPEDSGNMPTRAYGNINLPDGFKFPEYQQPEPVVPQTVTPAATVDFEGVRPADLTTEVDRLIAALEAQSVKDTSKSASESLLLILEAIGRIETNGVKGVGGEPGPSSDSGSIYDRIGKAGEGGVKWGWGKLKSLWTMTGKLQDKVWGAGKKGFGGVRDFASGMLGRFNKDIVTDVYTNGEIRMTAAKLQAGEYFDAVSGEVIKSWKDVKGAVKDKDGKIVLTLDQFKDGLRTFDGKKVVTGLANWLGDKAGGIIGWTTSQFWKGLKTPKQIFDFGKNFLSKYLNKPIDIYVPGETKPRLTAIGFQNGEYYSSKTYKKLSSHKDIDSDVLDSHGTVRLTLEELQAGVVDQNGKPITSFASKVMRLANKGFDIAKKAGKWVGTQMLKGFSDLKSLAGGGIDMFKRMFGMQGSEGGGGRSSFFGGSDATQIEQLNVLKMIYNLLRRQFGVEGDDLPMSDMPTPGGGLGGAINGIKDRFRNWKQKRDEFVGPVRPMKEVVKDKLSSLRSKGKDKLDTFKDKFDNSAAKAQMDEYADKIKDAISKVTGTNELNDGKDTVLAKLGRKAGDARATLRELVKEKNNDDRKNSWMQILADRKKKAEEAKLTGKKEEGKKEEGSSIWSKLLVGIMGIWSTIKGVWGTVKSFVTGLGSIKDLIKGYLTTKGISDAADVLGGGPDLPDGDGKDKGKKGGKLKRAGAAAKRFGGRLLSAGKWAGRALLSTGGWAVRGGLALAGGVGTILTSPVTLTAAAVAVTAYGGYKLYRYFKDSLSPLQKVRMAMYGLDLTDRDKYLKVGELELMLKKHLRSKPNGPVELDNQLDYEELMSMFGINMNSTDQRIAWATWFAKRFKPVYLSSLSQLNKLSPATPLEDVDSELDDGLKVPFIRGTKFTDGGGPYSVSASPFGSGYMQTGTEEIDAAIEEVVAKYGSKEGSQLKQNAVTYGKKDDRKGNLIIDGKTATSVGQAVKSSEIQFKTKDKLPTGVMLQSESNLKDGFGQGRSRTIDDLAAVRVATYGLIGLDVGRVNTLLSLEQDVLKDVTYSGKKAVYSGDPMSYYENYAAAFGGGDPEHRAAWKYWFQTRFIKVLLNYANAVRNQDSTINPAEAHLRLTKRQQFDVAKAIVDTHTTSGGERLSVWSIVISPFAKSAANQDRESVKKTLESMEASIGKDDYAQAPFMKLSADVKIVTPKDMFSAPVQKAVEQYKGGVPKALQPPTTHQAASSNPILQNSQGTNGLYNDVPKPTGDGSYEAMRDTLMKAAEFVGLDPGLLATVAQLESSFRAGVKAPTSSASGLFQFLASTWRGMMDKYGDKYGIPANARPTDPVAAALLGAQYLKDNQNFLERKLGRSVTATDVYMAHFMGPGGSLKFLKTDPNAIGAEAFPKEAKSNQSIFYDKSGRAKTIAEIYQTFDQKVSKGQGFRDAVSAKSKSDTAAAAVSSGVESPTSDSAISSLVNTKPAEPMVDLSKVTPKAPAEKSTVPSGMPNVPGSPTAPVMEPNVKDTGRPTRTALDKAMKDPITDIADAQKSAVQQKQQQAISDRAAKVKAEYDAKVIELAEQSLRVQIESRDHLKALVDLQKGIGEQKQPAPTQAKRTQETPLSAPPKQPISVARNRSM